LAKFETDGKNLYIDGKKVLRAWESWNGWYWFATEKIGEQMSIFDDGEPVKDTIYFGLFDDGEPVKDTIYFGLVQGFEEEWGYSSQAEIERLRPKTWEIARKDLVYAGRRKY